MKTWREILSVATPMSGDIQKQYDNIKSTLMSWERTPLMIF